MNRLVICGHGTNERSPAFKLLESEPNHWSVVFINNPTEPMPRWVEKLAKDALHLQFDDIVFENKRLRMPNAADIVKALEWTKEREDVLFACHAGISRSAAMAYICACQDFYPDDAINLLKPGVHSPNQKIIQIGTDLLNDRKVLEVFKEWLDKDSQTNDIGIEYMKY